MICFLYAKEKLMPARAIVGDTVEQDVVPARDALVETFRYAGNGK